MVNAMVKFNQKLFKQVKISSWLPEINNAIAVLKHEPKDLEKKLRLIFSEPYDQLDYFKVAVFEVDHRKQFALVRYRNCPSPGAELWSKDDSNIEEDIATVLTAF